MGVDASLFAVESKRYISCWRAHNLMPPYMRRLQSKTKTLTGEARDVYSNEEMQAILMENIRYYLSDSDDGYTLGSAKLNLLALEWVKAHPTNRFMFVTDHSSPSDYDIAEKEHYIETTQDELEEIAKDALKIFNLMYDNSNEDESDWD